MTHQTRLRSHLLALALFCCGPVQNRAHAQDKAVSTKPLAKKKMKPQPLHPLKKGALDPTSASQFGVGVGLYNFFPPQPTLEGSWRQDQYVVSAEAGVFGLNGGEFAASSTYFGVAGRYLFTPTFFAGMGLGKRHIVIMTKADMAVNDTTTPIKWTRTTDQMVVTPKIGWESFANRSTSLLFSLGLLAPFGTKFETTRDMVSIAGLPDEDLEKEEEKKGNDVRKFTTVVAPYLELKYAWFF